MRENKIRFGETAWRLIQEESEREGVRPSQYVREATLAWAILQRARRKGETPTEKTMVEALRSLRRLD